MIRIFTYFLLSLLLVGVSIFAIQNSQIVTLRLFNQESINLPLGVVLVFSAGLGTLVITVLQVSNRRAYSQVTNSSNSQNPSSYQTSKTATSRPRQTAKKEVADFDDDIDADWG
jgi:uncharacterized integral membrane protein